MDDSNKNSASEVLKFWFGSEDLTASTPQTLTARWFQGGPAFDDEIRSRFASLVKGAIAGQLPHWDDTLQGQVALILVCDQFTRNIYRTDARAFAGDEHALAFSQALIRDNRQQELGLHQRAFVGMPLEHSELPEVQAQSVAYFAQLREDFCDGPEAEAADSYYRFAVAHQEVITEYGRFPHRNAKLQRETTPAEQSWLDAGGGF